jgi:tetratricopeptide (TPR) repeat protein
VDKRELLERYEALSDERDFTAAKPLYEQALNEREDARVLCDFGYLLECHGRSELRRAVALYERAIDLDSDYDKPHYQLISARAGLREPELAVDLYVRRLAASPSDVRVHRFLAQAYLAAHAFAKAREVAEGGLALAPRRRRVDRRARRGEGRPRGR